MALQAPQQQRQIPHASPSQQPQRISVPSPQRKRPLEDSQEWVLFSPVAAPSTAQTQTTSTERTPKTAGRSQLSDFGSLDTAARSQEDEKEDEKEDDDITCQGTEIDEEENEELDSLDDGLHAFHEPPEGSGLSQRLYQSAGILPTHDGLGAFRTSASPVQEQLWHYERYNPRRKQVRRRSSIQRKLDALEGIDEFHKEDEKNQWIERWRMEQSKALLEEIERETRRQRRMSRQSISRGTVDTMAEDQASMSGPTMEEILTRPDSRQGPARQMENESIWQRFTRHVINDLMGFDEDLLSVIFGETLPADAFAASNIPQPAKQEENLEETAFVASDSWQQRLLQRIARELGFLIFHMSEHPGAFSTYLRTQETPDHAGISTSFTPDHKSMPTPHVDINTNSLSDQSAAPFAPTLQQPRSTADASVWGIDTELSTDPLGLSRSLPNIAEEPPNPTISTATQEHEYWERTLNVTLIFGFLRSRFSRTASALPPTAEQEALPPTPSPPAPRRDSAIAQPENRRRAALIRRHHPLTSRGAAAESRRSDRSYLLHHHHHHHHHRHHHQHGYGYGYGMVGGKRPGSSSCASQSTRSKKSLGRQSGTGSGRNYWDLGGSVGSVGIGSDAGVA